MDITKLKNILEALLLTTDHPLTVPQLEQIFSMDEEQPTRDEIRKALHELGEDYAEKCMELKQVASGFRIQVKQDYTTWVSRLWEEKPSRYSRALLETLALIAYRQPITRGEIEEVRGVSVSSSIIKTCVERDWIRVLGHKDVPGKPALYGTTREFLDYFNLKTLDQLPTLAEIKDLDQIHPELALEDGEQQPDDAAGKESSSDDEDGAAAVADDSSTAGEQQQPEQQQPEQHPGATAQAEAAEVVEEAEAEVEQLEAASIH